MTDHDVLQAIQELLDEGDLGLDTLEKISQIMVDTGFPGIRPPDMGGDERPGERRERG